MAQRGIEVPGAPTPVGHYPHARRVGDLLYISGAGPRDTASNTVPGNVLDDAGKVVDHDITAQWHSVTGNVEHVLAHCGRSSHAHRALTTPPDMQADRAAFLAAIT